MPEPNGTSIRELIVLLEAIEKEQGDMEVVYDLREGIRYAHKIDSVQVNMAGDGVSKLVVLSPRKH